jgi:hypothetical protein
VLLSKTPNPGVWTFKISCAKWVAMQRFSKRTAIISSDKGLNGLVVENKFHTFFQTFHNGSSNFGLPLVLLSIWVKSKLRQKGNIPKTMNIIDP